VGKIAIGGYAKGTVAIGAKAAGRYCINTHHIGHENKKEIYNLIKGAYPKLPRWICNLFTSLNITMN